MVLGYGDNGVLLHSRRCSDKESVNRILTRNNRSTVNLLVDNK